MDIKYINPFVLAITSVFETMVHTKVRVGKPALRTDTKSVSDVSGVIGLSGDATGSVVLAFPMDVACKAASAFAGSPIDQSSPDFADAIGELANMVAGKAKALMNGSRISISLPSVIVGKEHTVSQSRTSPRIVIPCETDLGSVYVDVAMKIEKAATSAAA